MKTKTMLFFVKKAPLHPRDRLKRAAKKDLFHPRDRIKQKQLKIGRNVTGLMEGKSNFSLEQILSKTILFDISKINEKKTVDKIIVAIQSCLDNDELIRHEPG